MKKIILVIMFLLFNCALTMAQTSSTPKAEVYGGYSYLHTEFNNGLNGFDTSITGNINKNFGVTADVSGLYKNGSSLYTYMFGPRYSFRMGNDRFKPFVHVLVGGTAPTPAFAYAIGGGLDVKVNDRISVRVIQADFVQIRNGGSALNSSRYSFGVVFNLGKK
jgi:hypothetical protein